MRIAISFRLSNNCPVSIRCHLSSITDSALKPQDNGIIQNKFNYINISSIGVSYLNTMFTHEVSQEIMVVSTDMKCSSPKYITLLLKTACRETWHSLLLNFFKMDGNGIFLGFY